MSLLAHRETGEDPVSLNQVSVDVLIVGYNSVVVLRNCLESIRRHRPPADAVRLQVNVYDNASQDGTAKMVADEFPEVVLHESKTNDGFGAANNRLAERSDADYLLLLNPDTVWERDVVTPLLKELRRNAEAVLAAPRLIYPDGREQLSSQLFPSLRYEMAEAIRGTKLNCLPGLRNSPELLARVRTGDAAVARETRRAEFLWATCWLIEADWVRRYGLFDERFPLYDEDLDFCKRLRRANAAALYVPAAELVHVGGASSNEQSKLELMRSARARYYRLNHGILAAWLYQCVILSVAGLVDRRARRRRG
jgi:N-acetylglucosaminyl-diphospho-decaprenol L-rhamnosyltransferase